MATAESTIQNVEHTQSTEGSMHALTQLNEQLGDYSKGHTPQQTQTYWDRVTQKLRDDNVLPEMAIAWGNDA
jgi:hypothetical protein